MNAKTLLAVASVAAAFSGMARAGEADQFLSSPQVQNQQRSRAEVKAEAVQAARNERFGEADLSVPAQWAHAARNTHAVRDEAAQAVRLGQIRAGEAS
ncbi:DUF4148 domain-containing protein [Ramlibacter humi]|uniref:DUF4148 domain-containing protein n=1 Tax=Ramlibacter humi TaxID=2530451 RepID=A0A4Z0BW93_9BURK|nr:DUF4148 domain-containing protein [Ramlibacter humi]TFZ03597.1 DUF4148 domain-containing protein [Ramlibacter humi]